jgi:hypothetical protein
LNTLEYVTEFFNELSPILIGAIVVAVVFLALGIRLVLKQPPSHLTAFSGEAGSVLVSRKALQELIKQACLLDEWVEAARPLVQVKTGKVSAKVEIRLAAPENLKEVCERVQSRITGLLEKSLSFDQIGDIQIVVKSFAPTTEGQKIATETLLPQATKAEPSVPEEETEKKAP